MNQVPYSTFFVLILFAKALESNRNVHNRQKEKNSKGSEHQSKSGDTKRIDDGFGDKFDLKEKLEEVTRNLKERENKFKVTIDSLFVNN